MPKMTEKTPDSIALFDETGSRSRRPSAVPNKSYSDRSGHQTRKPQPKRSKKAAAIIVDVVIAALIMVVFYITNYVVHTQSSGSQLPNQSAASVAETADPAQADTTDAAGQTDSGEITPPPEEATQPADTVDATSLRVKFADKFTSGAVEQTETSYRNANINVSIEKVQQNDVTYYLADIYVADIQYFRTAFAVQPDVMGKREMTNIVAKENNAIIAINGDHCVDNSGPVVRNGQLYRDETFADALVMNYDGSMQTFSADQLDMDAIKANGAWQVWTFGPMLLQDGQPMTKFNSTLLKANPRTAVGYYEPGHYCFLVVDGRQTGYSVGMSLQELSQFFYDKGCKVAFNLDGGQSSEMVFMGNVVNQPYDGGRSTNDILYIAG